MTALYREKLGWRIDDLYETLNSAVSRSWRWGHGVNAPEALGDLAQTLALDPGFRVLVDPRADGRAARPISPRRWSSSDCRLSPGPSG